MKRTVILFMILAPLLIFGQIINIPDDYATIQEGINAAVSGDTVLVQPGTYLENLVIDAKSITLTSTFLLTNDPSAIAETIIDAGNDGKGIFLSGAGPGMTIAGLTIQNGNAADSPGGGIEIHGSSVFIRDVVVTACQAPDGGGIFCEGSTLLLLKSNIVDNIAIGQGGGIKIVNTNFYLDQCQLTFNQSESGAALRCDISMPFYEIFNVTLDSCLIASNTAIGQGGGAYFRRNSNAELNIYIKRTNFLSNSAASSGAGLQIRGDSANFEISGCKFMYNSVTDYSAGATLVQGCSGSIENCVFADNEAALGGAEWSGGGLTCWATGEVMINNCTFAHNKAAYGAGLNVGPSAVVYATNCILWGNNRHQISLEEMNGFAGTLFIDYCDVQYGEDSVFIEPLATLNWGDHNMDQDPYFLDVGEELYSLSNNSPCIDAGPEEVTGWDILPYDILGNVRIWDGDENGSAVIDMGAYEFGAPIYIGIPEHPVKSLNGIVIRNIYPNPVRNAFTIDYELPDDGQVSCRIFSINGKMVNAFDLPGTRNGTVQKDVSHLSPGVYLVNLYSENSFALRKIIIQ